MTIKVEQRDIDEGVPINPCGCPVSRAISRNIGKGIVAVSYPFINIIYPKTELQIKTPRKVKNWMTDFDRKLPVQPFEFELGVEL